MHKPSKHPVFDRLYRQLKYELLNFKFAPHIRLNLEQIADDYDVSTIPVREVCRRLNAEGLLHHIPGRGYFYKQKTLEDFQNRQQLTLWILLLSLDRAVRAEKTRKHFARQMPVTPLRRKTQNTQEAETLVDTTEVLFVQIALFADNALLPPLIKQQNDHLRVIRLRACPHFPDLAGELTEMLKCYAAKDFRKLRKRLLRYHVAEKRLLPSVLRELSKPSRCPDISAGK